MIPVGNADAGQRALHAGLEQRLGDQRAEPADHDVVLERHDALGPRGESDDDLRGRTA